MNGFHHLDDATIVSYASGTLSESLLPVVARHVARCPRCKESVRRAEAIGGAMLETLPPQQMQAGALDTLLDRID